MAFANPSYENNKTVVQPKLSIGQPGDKYEQEADAVADQVMKMPTNATPGIQRKCEKCEEDELQMKPLSTSISPVVQKQSDTAGPIAPSNLSQSIAQSKGSGQSLPESTRSLMSTGIGADFSHVKIHTDDKAIQMNRQLHARAFTHGSDVYFDRGQYDPNSTKGKHLLAHELTHVVQQGKGNLSIQGDWREDAETYYEDAKEYYEEVKRRGSEAIEEAERKADKVYQDGKEYYNRAEGYGERKWSEAEELYNEGTEKAGEIAEQTAEDAEGWWNSGSGDVTKIEFNGRRVQVYGKSPYTALANSGLRPNHPNLAKAGLPPNTDATQPQYQTIPGVGPIPEGSYFVVPEEAESNPPASFPTGGWGKYRTRLHERAATYAKRWATTEREGGFFIHEDADKNGTAGCIGFLSNTDNLEVYNRIKNNSAQIPVEVKYTAPVMVPGTGPAEEANQESQ